MSQHIKMAAQRRIIARLVMDLMMRPAETHLGTSNFGSRCDDIVLMCAILIGQIDGRPMTAAKLAAYAGMPRPTVVRKLRNFQNAGMVEISNGFPVGTIDHLNCDGIMAAVEQAVSAIHRASSALSKMDTQAVAINVNAGNKSPTAGVNHGS